MSDDDSGSERRRGERVPINAEFGRMPAPIFVSDLSEGGVFVHTEQRMPIGTELSVRFTVLLDDPVVIEARGRVVRHQLDPAGIGIAFTQLNPDMALRIDDVLTRQRPRDLGRPLRTGADPAARRSAPPATGDTRVMRPPQPVDDGSNDDKTQVRLRAVDVEILDEDAELDDDAADEEREP